MEEIQLNDEGIAKNCLYLSKCTGVERSSVIVFMEVSVQQFVDNSDIIF